MRTFNSNKVKPSSHLAVPSYRQSQVAIRERKLIERKANETVKRVRDFLCPMKLDFAPKPFGRKRRGLSHEKRALVLQRALDREMFFASI